MFVDFYHDLKSNGVPVSLREYLSLLEALDRDVINRDIQEFYYLSRAALVKDEKNLDKFDVVFGKTFKGLQALSETEIAEIPTEWLQSLTEKFLTEEEKAAVEALGGWEKIMEELQKRLEEQKERHEGGNKWI
ncbi:MAG: VWA domain-containing protein, partial [Pseudomonadota bacterium]|nr:VWA domain-containing protein [Pseudomonadota bacterium]